MALQSLDIKQRSATTTPAPSVRQTTEVAKLIDVSTCIGCKTCQAVCCSGEAWTTGLYIKGDGESTLDGSS